MRRWLVIGVALVVAAAGFATFAVLARTTLPGRVTAPKLSESVAWHTGSASDLLDDGEPCVRGARPGVWLCELYDAEGSGGVRYRVRVDDDSCWTARLVRDGGEGGTARTARGCVHLWQWSLLDLL